MVTPIGTCRGLINDTLEQKGATLEDLVDARDATTKLLNLVTYLRFLQVPAALTPVEISLRDLVEDEVGSWGIPATSVLEPSPKAWAGNLESQIVRRVLRALIGGLKEFATLLGAGDVVSLATHCGSMVRDDTPANSTGVVTLEAKVESPQIRYSLPSPSSIAQLAETFDSPAVVPLIIADLLARSHRGCCALSYIPDLGFSGRVEIGQLEPMELPHRRSPSPRDSKGAGSR
jgi:hypothetical protein